MSRATQLAKEEADQLEEEEAAEEETDGEPESEPEEPTGPQTEKEIEAARQAILAENIRHAEALHQILGPDFTQMFACPTCSDFALGFTWTAPEELPLLQGEEYERCAGCNGRGRVLTGAADDAPGFTQTHLACNGQGYVTKATPLPTPILAAAPASPQADMVNMLRTQGYVIIDPPQPWTPPQATPQAS